MNKHIGWALAILALVVGWVMYRWPGVVMALTIIVFWLLLQFGRAMRVMANAGRAPVGAIPNAVMVHSRLREGMTMLELLQVTRALGEPVAGEPDTWRWTDRGGDTVTVALPGGRLQTWHLKRNDSSSGAQENGTAPASP